MNNSIKVFLNDSLLKSGDNIIKYYKVLKLC